MIFSIIFAWVSGFREKGRTHTIRAKANILNEQKKYCYSSFGSRSYSGVMVELARQTIGLFADFSIQHTEIPIPIFYNPNFNSKLKPLT